MITPLYDKIVIRRTDERMEKTEGGIHIPSSAQEEPSEGVVIAVGIGRWEHGSLASLQVKEGDKVLFGKYAGNKIRLRGEDLLIMREDEVLAVLD
jgi:chaperonin GroES